MRQSEEYRRHRRDYWFAVIALSTFAWMVVVGAIAVFVQSRVLAGLIIAVPTALLALGTIGWMVVSLFREAKAARANMDSLENG